jgi:hypothetical protein
MFVLKNDNGGAGCIVGWLLPLGDWRHSNHGKKRVDFSIKEPVELTKLQVFFIELC